MSPTGAFKIVTALFLLSGVAVAAQSSGQASAKQKAIADLKQVAYAGDANAQVQLGVIYLTGDGVAKDDTEAMKWLRKAADQDSALAQRYLAEIYFKGRGVPADDLEAAKWLKLAAAQGDAESEHNLAVLYSQGRGVAQNDKEAVIWMRRAADQNLAAAQKDMGEFYASGAGVEQDPVEAVKWYRKAVDQDYVPAMNSLALLMATTTDSHVRNPQEAIALAGKAVAAAGNPEYLDTLAAAYFAGGQIDNAVKTEQRALARDPQNDSYKKALEKYLAAANSSH